MNDDRRLIEWIDLTAELLQRPRLEFPRAEIGWQLTRTFDVLAVSWDWRDDRGAGSQVWPEVDVSAVADLPYWHQDQILGRHPLVRWFVTTQDPTAQSMGRVPPALAPRCDRELIASYLGPIGVDQQLSLPYLLSGHSYGAFVLSRPGDDFSDDDLALARHLQRLIRGIYLHSAPVEQIPTSANTCRAATHAALTATELAVLLLLSEGHTAHAIGRRLAMSPRTAQKHLEHIYRKLSVKDRLAAVLVAREASIVPAQRRGDES